MKWGMYMRSQRALETKKKITEKAISLINEKGFQNVTVDEIIKETSTSKGSFYNHFESKHDIISVKFDEIDDYYIKEIIPNLNGISSNIKKIKLFLNMQMEYIENDIGWDIVRTIYEHELDTERKSSFLKPDRELYKILKVFFEKGQKKGEFIVELEVDEMLNIIIRVMRGILYDWSIKKGNYPLQKESSILFKYVLKGLTK